MKKLQALLFIFSLISVISCNQKPRDWNEIEKDGKLKVAIEYNALGYYHSDDSISGIQYQMISAFCKENHIEPIFEMQENIEKGLKGIEDGQYDVVASLIPTTSKLKERVAFTSTICLDKQVLVQRKTKDSCTFINNQLKLPGHCITMPKNSPYIARLKNLEKEIGDTLNIEEVDFYQSEQIIILIANGDMDYTVCSYSQAARMAKTYPQIDYSTNISFNQMQAWALNNKSPELLARLNSWLEQHSEEYFKK